MVLLTVLVIIVVGDRPLVRAPGYGTPTGRAALAYRDREIPFFQWGTQIFTQPLLEDHYAEVRYITERQRGDRRLLFSAAADLLAKYESVDVFLAVHGERRLRRGFRHLPHRERLRLVYSTGCADARFGQDWLDLGADAFVGHDGVLSVSPLFYVYFLRRWVEGLPLVTAVEQANAQMANRLAASRLMVGAAQAHALVNQTRARIVGEARRTIGQ